MKMEYLAAKEADAAFLPRRQKPTKIRVNVWSLYREQWTVQIYSENQKKRKEKKPRDFVLVEGGWWWRVKPSGGPQPGKKKTRTPDCLRRWRWRSASVRDWDERRVEPLGEPERERGSIFELTVAASRLSAVIFIAGASDRLPWDGTTLSSWQACSVSGEKSRGPTRAFYFGVVVGGGWPSSPPFSHPLTKRGELTAKDQKISDIFPEPPSPTLLFCECL